MTASYGTITINASATSNALSIDSVTVTEAGGQVVITNGPVSAPSGAKDGSHQAQVATAVAASIIAKTGLANQYTACTRTNDSCP